MRLCLWQLGVFVLFVRQVYSTLCIEHTLHSRSPPSSALVPCGSQEQQLSKRFDSINDPITFDFTCRSASQDECAKVNNTLIKAGQILASVIRLNNAIRVNASYLPFCQDLNDCDTANGALNVGQAYPAVSYLMVDETDNMTRMYPQAMLKQFDNLPAEPQWSEYDIKAQFNSEVDWYFPSDNRAIDTNETDLLRTVVHELVHGLGFVNSWSDVTYAKFSTYIPSLTPFLVPMELQPPNELAQVLAAEASLQGNQPFWGFVEFPLDKYLYTKNTSLTTITRLLNTWGNSNVMFNSILDMVNAWYCLEDIRTEAQMLYKLATTAQDIWTVFPDGTTLLLETSLSQFISGTSLSHVDRATYGKTPDFLMVYYTESGVTLDTLVLKYDGGPIGSHLLHALASLGYALQPSLNMTIEPVRPKLSFWEASADLVGTTSNPSPSVSINTDGPAKYPTATSTTSSSPASSLFFVNLFHYIVPLLILLFFSFTF